ncbi:MAG: molybdopterin molybdotransferase MoeA [Litorivicinaceae bacterium]
MLQFISMEEAFAQIKARASSRRIPASQVPLEDTVGCVLAEPAVANLSIPPFNNSARDGVVLSPMGLKQARGGSPISLAGELRAGDSVEAANGIQGDAARIMTGAPIPVWAEAVVMIEDLEFKDDGTVLVKKLPGSGAWIRPQGSDIAAGSAILNSGRRIIPEHVQALASSGIVDLVVYDSPRVGLCSTGEELVDVKSGPPGSGQIYDSNRPFMTAMIRSFGCDVVINDHVGDTLEEMVGFLNRVMDESLDLVVSSGAVSMGSYDFVKPALEAVGAEIVFHKVTQKPGKPLLFAILPNGTLYFGLPGNPVSTVVNCRFYVHHALSVMLQRPPETALELRLENDAETPEGMAVFLKARCIRGQDGAVVRALEGQESFQTMPLLEMNGWIVLGEQSGSKRAGDLVSFYPSSPQGLTDIF